MEIENIIKIINESYNEIDHKEKLSYTYIDAELTFKNGYCYEYYLLLKRFYPTAKLMMQNDKMHCAALIDGVIYDVSGVVFNQEDFHEATGCDLEYIYKYYDVLPYGLKHSLTTTSCKKVYEMRNKCAS